MASAAIGAGAELGIMVEVHQNPSEALSDGPQSLTPENFSRMVTRVSSLTQALQDHTAYQK
jgi:3-deoxy-7-phosphoheptulonate synthase